MASSRWVLGVQGIALLVLAAAPAAAAGVELPAPPDAPWQPLHFRRIERETRYTAVAAEGGPALRADSDCSASALWLPLDGIDLARTPRLSWRWRVLEGLESADEQSRAGDDFAARVYVLFRPDPSRQTWASRARRQLARLLYGREPPGSALVFVWSGSTPVGAVWQSPYAAESMLLAIQNGPPGGWARADVDVGAEYEAAFGRPAPPLLGLAVMSDSDDTCQSASALFADFRFAAAAEPAARRRVDGADAAAQRPGEER